MSTTHLFSMPLHSAMIINTTTSANATTNSYDYNGAAMYAAGILICYSTGLVLMLFVHVRPRTFQNQFIFDYEAIDGSTTSINNSFTNYHHVQTNNTNKQILNELKDPQRREHLWRIYYSSREKQNEPHPQYYQTVATDNATIGLINKKLATIHRMNVSDNANMDSSNVLSSSTTKFLSKSMRRLSNVSSKPPPLIRVNSVPDILTATSPEEAHSFICEIQPKIASINSSRGQMNRFTVEKISNY